MAFTIARMIGGMNATQPIKTPGQLAYERDVAKEPCYPDGVERPAWDRISDIARWSWERNPTDR